MRFVLLFSALFVIAAAKCKGGVKCSQGKEVLSGEPNFVLYKDSNGQPYWAELEESVSSECIVVIYSECSVQAFGKADQNAVFAPPGECKFMDGKVFCACDDENYCNINLNKWFEKANAIFNAQGNTMNCPTGLKYDGRYKDPEACEQEPPMCPSGVRCSQGLETLNGQPNFVLFKDSNGQAHWADLEESVTSECIIVIYNECSVQAFGKGDVNAFFAPPGGCDFLDGKVYCACNDAHYCNINLNKWFTIANEMFNAHNAPMNCPKDLTFDARYKTPEACGVGEVLPGSNAGPAAVDPVPETTPKTPKKPDSAGKLNALMAVSGSLFVKFSLL